MLAASWVDTTAVAMVARRVAGWDDSMAVLMAPKMADSRADC